ncbi:hypothetical protein LCGC14_2839500, partial [marine sediment metagenome]
RTGKYLVNVDPDSSLPQTRALRERKAIEMYSILRSNPLIDPVALTQYLLHELHGVQFDNLMRALPMQENTPSGVVGADQFGALVGQGMQDLQAQGQKALPPSEAFSRIQGAA